MKAKRFGEEQIIGVLKQMDAGRKVAELAREVGVSEATLYNWRRQYAGMDADAAKELKELREQNSRLKRLLADAELEKDALREIAKDAPIEVKWSELGSPVVAR